MTKYKNIFLIMLSFCFSMQVIGQVNLQQGLVAYYPFNGNANDESGNGNNGIVSGAIFTNDRFGNPNRAYYFDGINAFIQANDSPSLNFQNSNSIIAWFKTDDPDIIYDNDVACLLGKHSTHWCRSYGIHMYDSIGFEGHSYDSLRFVLFPPDNSEHIVEIPSHSLYNSNWHQIVTTYDYSSGFVNVFIDNLLLKSVSSGQFDLMQTTEPLLIACYGANGCGSSGKRGFFHGFIDDIRIYNRLLNQDEITALYTEGADFAEITITHVSQRTDGSGMMDVYFNLIGTEYQYNINLMVSFNAGGTYNTIPSNFLTGDVSTITPGNNKHIAWNGLESFPNTFSVQSKVKIIANPN